MHGTAEPPRKTRQAINDVEDPTHKTLLSFNTDGLLFAFHLGKVERCDAEALATRSAKRPMWLHFNLADGRARRWLTDDAQLPAVALETLLEAEPRVHARLLPGALTAVLGDLRYDLQNQPEELGILRIYLDQERMITARRYPLRTVDALRRELNAQPLDLDTPIALFNRFVETLADTFGTLVADLTDQVDRAEDDILLGHIQDQGTRLGRVRQLVALLRRQVSADRVALSTLPARLPEWCTAHERKALSEAVEHLETVGQDLNLVQERSRLLQEEIAGRFNEATSRNLYLLSTVTTVLLPVTLVAGLFGMNVGGLPWVGDPNGFTWIGLIMLALVVGAVLLVRRGRVL